MPKIKYIDKKFYKKSLVLLSEISDIIEVYEKQGYNLSLRQLYYQLVSKNVIPNSEKSYTSVGNLVNDARLAGHIDWYAIEDRSRNLRGFNYNTNKESFLQDAVKSYILNPWEGQDYYVEVWVEKDALIDVVQRAATRYEVDFMACRGFMSLSEMWRAARRFIEAGKEGKDCVLIHLGDHDPSGIDMTRDIQDRFQTLGAKLSVDRIALNYPQIEEYNPPPNPVKETDKRYIGYKTQFGDSSWELDALEPSILDKLIQQQILKYLDLGSFEKVKARQEKERQEMLDVIKTNI